MQKTNKFSSLVEQLAAVWWDWMKADTLCRDNNLSYKDRVDAARSCEDLIKQEYEIIDAMDNYFK